MFAFYNLEHERTPALATALVDPDTLSGNGADRSARLDNLKVC
jgi:hypothetical protein